MKDTKNLTVGALIGALYVVLTLIAQALGLASGVVQVRISEALTILPLFTVAAVPGLTIGCIISNIMTGCAIWDVIFGSLATLIGAVGTRYIGKKVKNEKLKPIVGAIPPVVSNMLIVPVILEQVYGFEGSFYYFALTIGAGEVISCMLLGYALYKGLKGKVQW